MNALRLYLRLLGVSVRGQMQYRVAFIISAIGHFGTTVVEAVGVWALFDRFGGLIGWTLPQVALFYGTVNVSFAFTDALARGFDLFGTRFVKTGNFDRLLLRPRTTVLQIAGFEFTLFRVGRLIQGLIVMAWAIYVLDIDWDVLKVVLLTLSVLSTFLFFYGLVICQATLSFWTTESLEMMNTLTYGGVETAQYPLPIYKEVFQRFFTFVVPLACVTYFPLVGVLGIEDPIGSTLLMQGLAPFAGVAFFVLSLCFWHIGVRHYSSTGS
jgi:ABC-2 type transport system permease protein